MTAKTRGDPIPYRALERIDPYCPCGRVFARPKTVNHPPSLETFFVTCDCGHVVACWFWAEQGDPNDGPRVD
jgi:hypothetical protein